MFYFVHRLSAKCFILQLIKTKADAKVQKNHHSHNILYKIRSLIFILLSVVYKSR